MEFVWQQVTRKQSYVDTAQAILLLEKPGIFKSILEATSDIFKDFQR